MRADVWCSKAKFCAGRGRRSQRENTVKYINGVKEEMIEDFRVGNMILQDRESFRHCVKGKKSLRLKQRYNEDVVHFLRIQSIIIRTCRIQ
jgi:hypothetical protein